MNGISFALVGGMELHRQMLSTIDLRSDPSFAYTDEIEHMVQKILEIDTIRKNSHGDGKKRKKI